MRTKMVAFPADATIEDLRHTLVRQPAHRGQHLYPVVDTQRRIKGGVTRKQIHELMETAAPNSSLADILREPVVAGPDEALRIVVSRVSGCRRRAENRSA